ncbi:MAG: hypothetical protein LBG04_02170 [Holosporaceae bacterium]|jgi:hypothetical protein|nr:hypothetical protein [Holosporaceae bacterium]
MKRKYFLLFIIITFVSNICCMDPQQTSEEETSCRMIVFNLPFWGKEPLEDKEFFKTSVSSALADYRVHYTADLQYNSNGAPKGQALITLRAHIGGKEFFLNISHVLENGLGRAYGRSVVVQLLGDSRHTADEYDGSRTGEVFSRERHHSGRSGERFSHESDNRWDERDLMSEHGRSRTREAFSSGRHDGQRKRTFRDYEEG